jgi:L-fuconolactonase
MIDSHHHLWNYSVEEYPWIPPGSALAQDHLLAELAQASTAAGVDATVVVQARQTLAESHWLLGLADATDQIAGVIGWVPLMDAAVDDPLSRLAAHPKFKGVRHVLQDEPDGYFLSDELHRGLALLPDLDLHYDLLVYQRQLPVALEFIDRQPDLGIIIDHLAKPTIRNGEVNRDWKAQMAEVARREQVIGVKFSGLVTEVTDPELDPATLRSYFETALELFGVERLMFGSDWPVCLLRIESYPDWANLVRGFIHELSTDEQDAILHHNAVRIYGL